MNPFIYPVSSPFCHIAKIIFVLMLAMVGVGFAIGEETITQTPTYEYKQAAIPESDDDIIPEYYDQVTRAGWEVVWISHGYKRHVEQTYFLMRREIKK